MTHAYLIPVALYERQEDRSLLELDVSRVTWSEDGKVWVYTCAEGKSYIVRPGDGRWELVTRRRG